MMALRDVAAGPKLALTASPREAQRKRHVGPALEKPLFNWIAQDRYVELLNCEKKVTNILETKVYELTDEEKVPVIKNHLGQESLQLIKTFRMKRKKNAKE